MSTQTQITLIRHGKADKTLPNHREHPLSEEGLCQALNRRIALGHPQFDLVCHSILPRTKQTALLVSNSNATAMIEIPGLFWEEGDARGDVIDRAFDKFGHTHLGVYLDYAREEIMSLANESNEAIVRLLQRTQASNILIVSHSVMLQALCCAITGKDEPFTEFVCGECEGFHLIMNKHGMVVSIEPIK